MKQFVTEIWYGADQVDIKLSYDKDRFADIVKLSERQELTDYQNGCKRVRYWIRVANDGNAPVMNHYERSQFVKRNRAEAERKTKDREIAARKSRVEKYRKLFEETGKVFGE